MTCKQRLLDRGTPLDRIEKLPQKQQNLVYETFMQYIDEQTLDGVPVIAFDGNLDTAIISRKIAKDILTTINHNEKTLP